AFSPLLGASMRATATRCDHRAGSSRFQSPPRGFNECNAASRPGTVARPGSPFSPLLGASMSATGYQQADPAMRSLPFSPLLGASMSATPLLLGLVHGTRQLSVPS